MPSEDGNHRPYRFFTYQVSECPSNCSEGSGTSAWTPSEQQGLELRRPLRQAKIVFAEHFSQEGSAEDFVPGQPGRMASVFGAAEVDLFNAFLARERDRGKQEVVAMPYENISPCLDDNASESGITNKANAASGGSRQQEMQRRPAWVRWVLTVLVALCVALQCSCMLLAEIHLTGLKLQVVELLYWKGYRYGALGLLLGYGLTAAFLSALLVLFVSPRAASSGIPDTKAYLNGHHLPGFLSFKAWLARTCALILVTSAGLFAGSEGPLVAHLGAIISSGVARGRLRMCGKRLRMPWRLTGHRSQCEFVSIGTAMGVSAAFGSPVGGVLFSLEEVSSFWSNELTWRAFFGSAIAALFAKGLKNGFGSLQDGFGRKLLSSSFVEFPDAAADFQPWELLPIAFIGIVTGVLGALFCKGCHLIGRLRTKIYTKQKPRLRLRVFEVLLSAVAILLTCSLLPMAAGCRRLDASSADLDGADGWHVGDHARGHCNEGEYSDMATLLMQPKHVAIKALFTKKFNGGASFGPVALVSCCSIIFFFTLSANGMAMPYGLFVPHIMLGGCCGRAIGQLVQEVTGDEAVHPGVYALVGAAGQLAGISRMTVSLTMIMVEITSNMRLMLPLMLCVMVSKSLADRTGPSVFDVAIELNSQLQMLSGEWRESDAWSDDITVLDICSIEVVVLHCKERVSHIVKLLAQTDFHAFPLVEGQKAHVVGVIQRTKLLCAISKETPSGSKALIDLLPYANLTPEVKHWKTPVARVFTHFKSMGLSHLCVVDNHHGLMGFVTRSDMAQLGNRKGRKRLYEKLVKAVQLEQESKAKQVICLPPISKEAVQVPPVEHLVEKVKSHSTQRSKSSDAFNQGSSSGSSPSNSPPQTDRSNGSPAPSPPRSENAGSPPMSTKGPSRSTSLQSGAVTNTELRDARMAAELLKAKERELIALRSENAQLRSRLQRLGGEDDGTGDEEIYLSPPASPQAGATDPHSALAACSTDMAQTSATGAAPGEPSGLAAAGGSDNVQEEAALPDAYADSAKQEVGLPDNPTDLMDTTQREGGAVQHHLASSAKDTAAETQSTGLTQSGAQSGAGSSTAAAESHSLDEDTKADAGVASGIAAAESHLLAEEIHIETGVGSSTAAAEPRLRAEEIQDETGVRSSAAAADSRWLDDEIQAKPDIAQPESRELQLAESATGAAISPRSVATDESAVDLSIQAAEVSDFESALPSLKRLHTQWQLKQLEDRSWFRNVKPHENKKRDALK